MFTNGPTAFGASADVPIWNNVPVKHNGNTRYQVPYTLTGFNRNKENIIRQNLRKMSEDICIDFVEMEDYSSAIQKYGYSVININRGHGCHSMVGRMGNYQELSLGSNCYSAGTIQHEMMHALGFHHEQVRPDRDEYVVYHKDQVQNGLGGCTIQYKTNLVAYLRS